MGMALTTGGLRGPRLAWNELNSPSHPLGKKLRLPKSYASYVGLSALDALGTALILALGGVEVNPIADAILTHFGFTGMVLYKFVIVSLVILMCERIAREKLRAAKSVMGLAIGASCLPVLIVVVETACFVTSPG